jgi:hypothetical protein
MFSTPIIVLAVLSIIFIPLLLLRYFIFHIKYGSSITSYILLAIGCFGFGILYNSYRIISFSFTGTMIELIDVFCFQTTVFLMMLGMYLVLGILLQLNARSGHPIARAPLFQSVFLVSGLIFSVLNTVTYLKADTEIPGYYIFHVHPILNLLILSLFFSIFIFMLITLSHVLKELEGKTLLKFQAVILVAGLTVFTMERTYMLGRLLTRFVPLNSTIILLDLIAITIFWAAGFLIVLINPDFIETFNAQFSVHSLYLLDKEQGRIVYKFHFRGEPIVSNEFLLGGFLHSISGGLTEILSSKGTVEAIQFHGLTILFNHGSQLVGVLFVSDDIPLLHQHLLTFMQELEQQNKIVDVHSRNPIFEPEALDVLSQKIFR